MAKIVITTFLVVTMMNSFTQYYYLVLEMNSLINSDVIVTSASEKVGTTLKY